MPVLSSSAFSMIAHERRDSVAVGSTSASGAALCRIPAGGGLLACR